MGFFVLKWWIDLRNVIGLFFIVIGLILIAVTMSPLHKIVQDLDIQMLSGVVAIIFGVLMVISGTLATRKT